MSANAGDRRCGFYPWVGKISWREKQQPTLVFLPVKFHVQRSLAGYNPWVCKELDTTEHTHTHTHTHIHTHTHTHTHTYTHTHTHTHWMPLDSETSIVQCLPCHCISSVHAKFCKTCVIYCYMVDEDVILRKAPAFPPNTNIFNVAKV